MCFLLAGSHLIVVFVGQKTTVYGDSMEPVLSEGDVIWTDKISYLLNAPKRYDIIVFRYLFREDQHYIKRIIGLPGETVQIMDGAIFVDGVLLEESYGSEAIENPRRASEPVLLGENEYFVLGDNRNHSSDSRDTDIGNVKKDQIVGKAFLKIWPKSQIGVIRHQ